MSYYKRVMEVDKALLADRKEACAEFYNAMAGKGEYRRNDIANIVAERIGWLLDENYGQEETDAAHRILAMRANANKVAQLTHMIGVLEWMCPPKMAVAAWKKLTAAEKASLDKAIKAEIASNLESREG